MAVVTQTRLFAGYDLTGTGSNDYIIDRLGGATTILGGDGSDVIYGDYSEFAYHMNGSAYDALQNLATDYGDVFINGTIQYWSESNNSEIENSTTIAHMSYFIDVYQANYGYGPYWEAYTVAAGDTITIDIDQGNDTANGNTDTIVELYAVAPGGTVYNIATNDDSTAIDTGSVSLSDLYLTYTFLSAGTYLVKVSEFGLNNISEASDNFAMHVSLTNHLYSSNYGDVYNFAAGDDILRGGNGADTLYGMGGSDQLYGDDYNDLLYGGSGDDFLYGGSAAVDSLDLGDDILYGEAGVDTIYGNAGNDTIYGGLGADLLVGGIGNDTIYGGSSATDTLDLSDDFMRGGDGLDRLFGNRGNDTILGGADADEIFGGDGNDVIYGGAFLVDATDVGDVISGGFGNDDIRGNGGVDFLHGNEGNDSIIGGLGDDFIWGELGNDYLRGGDGADKFIFDTALNAVTNVDTIRAFAVGVDDIWLNQTLFAGIGDTLDASEFQNSSLLPSGEGTYRIFYNQGTGELFYDSNGSDIGGRTLFAVMTVGLGQPLPVLTVDDFLMIA
jgi:Ca2+-binding RTX toxin-like protein